MQDIRDKNKKVKKWNKKWNRRKIQSGLAIVLAGLLVVNLIPGLAFADVGDETETKTMEETTNLDEDNSTETTLTETSPTETTSTETTSTETTSKETTPTETISTDEESSTTETVTEEKTQEEILSEDGKEENSEDAEDTSKEITIGDTEDDPDTETTDDENPDENTEDEEHETSYTDSDTGVRIEEADDEALARINGFKVSNVSDEVDTSTISTILNYAGVYPSSYEIKAYDLQLTLDGSEMDPSGQVRVWIPNSLYEGEYTNYNFYILEGGEPTKLSMTSEGTSLFYTTNSLNRLYIYCYSVTETADDDTEKISFTINAAAAVNGEKNTEAGTIAVKNNSSIEAKAEINITATVKKTYTGTISLVATANEGYTFAGWYTSLEDGSTCISENVQLDITTYENADYYAVFTKDEEAEDTKVYVRAYVIVAGEKNSVAGTISVVDTAITPKSSLVLQVSTSETELAFEATASSENYSFIGWYANADGTGDSLSESNVLEIAKVEETTYYALFEKVKEDTVTVKAKVTVDGKESSSAGTIKLANTNYDAKASLTATLTKNSSYKMTATAKTSSYQFLGWYDTMDTSGNLLESESTLYFKATEDITYYAVFEKKEETATVKVAYTDGVTSKMGTISVEGESSAKITKGKSFTLKATANEGYTFTGWYEEESTAGVTPISKKTSLSLKLASNYVDDTLTYYACFKQNETKDVEPTVTLSNYGAVLTTNGLTLKKGYYQLTSTDVSLSECPKTFTSWYKFTQNGIAEEVASFNGSNGYITLTDLSNGSLTYLSIKGWYTFIFKDSDGTFYAEYLLVDGDNFITLTENTQSNETTATTTKTTAAANKTTKTTTNTNKTKKTTPTEEIVAADLDEEKTVISANIYQKSDEELGSDMLLVYEDDNTNEEEITKIAYGYVGEEEPEDCTSWYSMLGQCSEIDFIRNPKVTETETGRSLEFAVDQVGWYYLCVSNEENGEQYYKAYLENQNQLVENNGLELEVLGTYVTASLTEGKIAFIRTDESDYFIKGNRIKLSSSGTHDIYVINSEGKVYCSEVEIDEDATDKSNLSRYVELLQEELYNLTAVSEDEIEYISENGNYCTDETYNNADEIRYEGTSVLEDLGATQDDVDYETNRVKEAYEELINKIVTIQNDLVTVEDNIITITSSEGEYLIYVVYPVDETGEITTGMWTNYQGVTSGEFNKVTAFKNNNTITFTDLEPGVYSFAIRSAGQVFYRNAIVTEEGQTELETVKSELSGEDGLFNKATDLLATTDEELPIYNQLADELEAAYEAYDLCTRENQVQQLINEASKLGSIVLKVEKINEKDNLDVNQISIEVESKEASNQDNNLGMSIREK